MTHSFPTRRSSDFIASHARIGDLVTRAMAGRAGLLHTEEALLHTYRTRAVAGMAGFGMSAGLRAGTVAYIAGFPTGDPDLGIEAVGRLFQADVQRIFKIGAAIDLQI